MNKVAIGLVLGSPVEVDTNKGLEETRGSWSWIHHHGMSVGGIILIEIRLIGNRGLRQNAYPYPLLALAHFEFQMNKTHTPGGTNAEMQNNEAYCCFRRLRRCVTQG